ncbi:protein translocase subunit SecF [Balneola sp. MJW-20]|uniref:protein translocase subunit SecF n=1 Tax=Gracilimonas aurantiaca TaxID=3234185 RepID=UPI003466F951
MRWFETPNFNFTGSRKIAYVVSAVLILISVGAIISKGLQYGIDFKGGKEFVLEFDQPINVVEVRSSLGEPLGSVPEVKLFGSESDILIRTDNEDEINEVQTRIMNTLSEVFPDNPATVIKTDVVGPRFAEDLKSGALQAVIYAIVIIFIYIMVRFRNWTFSAGAVAALIHDVVITLGVFTILSDVVDFSLQIDQNIIAAFLTIVGYSLNDTVVVFDRIRENSNVHKGMDYIPMVNKSLNDTLSRTVITSVTTLFVVLVLFIFGGEVLKGFSFALIIGIILGTYSSLFVASALVVELKGDK